MPEQRLFGTYFGSLRLQKQSIIKLGLDMMVLLAIFAPQNINIMSCAPDHCPARLKATLTNFRSYCQKTCNSVIPVSNSSQNNASITKYRSYRQMKFVAQKNELTPNFTSKKQTKISPSKRDDPSFNFKQSELIDLIKLKLKQKASFDLRVKTEINEKEEAGNFRFKGKNAEVITNFVQTTKFVKAIKRKKIDLTVTNSKAGLFLRYQRPTKGKEIVIAIKQRPCSAIEYRSTFSPVKDYQAKLPAKYSAHYIPTQKTKTEQGCLEKSEFQRCREISGWEIQNQEEPFLEEVQQQKKRSRRKKKADSKIKQKM